MTHPKTRRFLAKIREYLLNDEPHFDIIDAADEWAGANHPDLPPLRGATPHPAAFSPFREALLILTNVEPPNYVVGASCNDIDDAHIDNLQNWCAQHCLLPWGTGIGTIEAAEHMVAMSIECGLLTTSPKWATTPQAPLSKLKDRLRAFRSEDSQDSRIAAKLMAAHDTLTTAMVLSKSAEHFSIASSAWHAFNTTLYSLCRPL